MFEQTLLNSGTYNRNREERRRVVKRRQTGQTNKAWMCLFARVSRKTFTSRQGDRDLFSMHLFLINNAKLHYFSLYTGRYKSICTPFKVSPAKVGISQCRNFNEKRWGRLPARCPISSINWTGIFHSTHCGRVE